MSVRFLPVNWHKFERMFSLLKHLLLFTFLLILPFILLIRISVYFHEEFFFGGFLAVLGGALMTALLVFIYSVIVQVWMSSGEKSGLFKGRFFLVLLLILGYVVHGILFISANNTKTEQVRSEYRELHPILRMSLSTLAHVDDKLILTDAQRQPEDYKKMGLKTIKNSLHYKQKDGYVYAVDLRTKGRSEIRNALTTIYFRLMGFKTLRHIGTADHLHISLYNHDRPYAK